MDQDGQAFGTTANAVSRVVLDKNKLKKFVRYTAVVTTGPVLLSVTLRATKKYR